MIQSSRFEIRRQVLGDSGAVAIAETRFQEIATARACLLEALTIEEKIDLVRENYRVLEQLFLDLSLQYDLYGGGDWSDGVANVKSVNRAIINLLSTCRMYVDHMPQHLNRVFGRDSTASQKFKAATRDEFDGSLGYRALYGLRNFVQHSGWPVHSLSHKRSLVAQESEKRHRLLTTAYLHLDYLVGSKFPSGILKELESMGKKIDVKPLVRENMGSFGRLHHCVREIMGPHLPKWEAVIQESISDFKAQHGDVTVGLAAVAVDEFGETIEAHQLFTEFIERRHFLEKRNRHLAIDAKSYISSEAADE